MSDDLVLYETRPPAAVLTLNRPDRRNALSRSLIAALADAFARTADDAAVRCVVLTGAGSVFCAGMDLAELQESVGAGLPRPEQHGEESPVWRDALSLANLDERIYTSPKPTIAAVNGAAVAGGAGLVSVCDLAVAVPEARFGYPEVRRGLVAAMVMPHLMRHVGERTARYLLLTGESIGAEEARQAGFLNAVPAGRLMETALQWARSLAEGGPNALARTKELLHRFSHQSLSLEEAAQASAAPRLTEECRHGLEAFFAKRLDALGSRSALTEGNAMPATERLQPSDAAVVARYLQLRTLLHDRHLARVERLILERYEVQTTHRLHATLTAHFRGGFVRPTEGEIWPVVFLTPVDIYLALCVQLGAERVAGLGTQLNGPQRLRHRHWEEWWGWEQPLAAVHPRFFDMEPGPQEEAVVAWYGRGLEWLANSGLLWRKGGEGGV